MKKQTALLLFLIRLLAIKDSQKFNITNNKFVSDIILPEKFRDSRMNRVKNNIKMVHDESKYTSIQCISLCTSTFPHNRNYPGFKNDTEDWQARCDLIKNSIENAYAYQDISTDPSTLKVFLLPEFFLRGVKGGYTLNDSVQISEKLRDIVSIGEYKDWLFVFGTTVAFSEIENSKNFEAYNYAFIQKGNSTEKSSVIVMKEYQSTIDFLKNYNNSHDLPPDLLTNTNTQYIPPVSKGIQRDEYKKFNYDSNSIFKMDGLNIGVEICLDNSLRRIETSNLNKIISLDLLLVPSSGLYNFNIVDNLSKNGVAFGCDGSNRSRSRAFDKHRNPINVVQDILFNISENIRFKDLFISDNAKLTIYSPHKIKERTEVSNKVNVPSKLF